MFETILSMWLPLTVLLVAGTLTLGLAWWVSLLAEGKDEWWYAVPSPKPSAQYPYLIACPTCGFTLGRTSHPGLYDIRCGYNRCEFQGTVTVQ